VARDYKQGAAGARELFAAFVEAPLFWLAPAQPGIPVVRIDDSWVAPVFSSEAELGRVVGRQRFLSTDGLNFLSLLPAGVRIGLDMGSPHRLELDPAAARLEFGLVLPGRREPRGAGTDGPDHDGTG
jgi:hypothetical protein